MQFPMALGVQAALSLANGWCHKLQYYYDAFKAGTLAEEGGKALVEELYEEPEDAKALSDHPDPKVQAALRKLRQVKLP